MESLSFYQSVLLFVTRQCETLLSVVPPWCTLKQGSADINFATKYILADARDSHGVAYHIAIVVNMCANLKLNFSALSCANEDGVFSDLVPK